MTSDPAMTEAGAALAKQMEHEAQARADGMLHRLAFDLVDAADVLGAESPEFAAYLDALQAEIDKWKIIADPDAPADG